MKRRTVGLAVGLGVVLLLGGTVAVGAHSDRVRAEQAELDAVRVLCAERLAVYEVASKELAAARGVFDESVSAAVKVGFKSEIPVPVDVVPFAEGCDSREDITALEGAVSRVRSGAEDMKSQAGELDSSVEVFVLDRARAAFEKVVKSASAQLKSGEVKLKASVGKVAKADKSRAALGKAVVSLRKSLAVKPTTVVEFDRARVQLAKDAKAVQVGVVSVDKAVKAKAEADRKAREEAARRAAAQRAAAERAAAQRAAAQQAASQSSGSGYVPRTTYTQPKTSTNTWSQPSTNTYTAPKSTYTAPKTTYTQPKSTGSSGTGQFWEKSGGARTGDNTVRCYLGPDGKLIGAGC